ncbi:MAG: outer membrane protein OmpA-like peptidoglycan-associated protein [Alphaproteobacteria bacterium]
MSDDVTSRSVAQGMARLKELLFDSEVETLGELDRRLGSIEAVNEKQARESLEMEQRVDKLFDRAGTQERFGNSVSAVLDKALADAEVRDHDQMSRAIAPLVVNTIRTELRNSQDELVDIMFPITGRMVKSYLAAEMKKLSSNVNRRIDHNPIMLRLRAIASGRPVRDLAIADTQRLAVDEVFLIRRGSGELIGHWPPSPSTMSNADVHMSGVLSAINDFAGSAFDNDGGNFESLRFEDFDVYMRASPVYLLAAKCNGIAPSGIEAIFDEAFLDTLERVTALERASANSGREVAVQTRSLELHPLTDHVETRTTVIYDELERTSVGGAVIKVVLFLIAVPLLTWFFWGLYTDAEEAIVYRSANHVITSTKALDGYQTNLDVGYRGKSITVTGLVPDTTVKSGLITALGKELPSTEVNARLAVVPKVRTEVVRELVPQPAPVVDLTGVERRFSRRILSMESQLIAASARRSIERANIRLRQAVPEIARLEGQIDGAARRADVRRVGSLLEKTIRDVTAMSAQIGSSGSDRAAFAKFVDPVNQATVAVGRAIKRLASIHGAGSNVKTVTGPAARTLLEATEGLSSQAERISTLAIALHQTAAMIPEPLAPVVLAPEISSEDKLRMFVARNAIFFSTGIEFASAAQTGKVLDDATAFINKAAMLVRVVGYTDERGGSTRNDELAENRAKAVIDELVRRGVKPQLLVAIGRSAGNSLSPGAGDSSPNRRVQFEVGFRGEERGSK